ncbi:hypothetical protein N0V90_011027 [Kalmusia sp. IMI 367209]|nr:hypothetical protein N0V90_011027 [Kalmusia sp. IMI 367209]
MSTAKDVEAASPSGLRQRKQQHNDPPVASRPFAGRIGGNQGFIISPSDSSFSSIVAATPDAAPLFTWSQSFKLRAFLTVDLWKEATIEGVGTCLQTYIAGLYAIGLSSRGTQSSNGPVTSAIIASVANVFLISLFIFGGGPVSGGHFNPLITMATFAAQLAAFPRAVFYVLETMTSFALLFIAFGVGLDPRQKGVFGPALSPILRYNDKSGQESLEL